jgi:hypothetical protein
MGLPVKWARREWRDIVFLIFYGVGDLVKMVVADMK